MDLREYNEMCDSEGTSESSDIWRLAFMEWLEGDHCVCATTCQCEAIAQYVFDMACEKVIGRKL